MNTASFLKILREHGDLPLVFRARGETVSPGYHLTEVKRVSYETMDCGAMTHRWAEIQFEIWVPPLAGITPGRGHMSAEKFLRIIDRVEKELPLPGDVVARIHASFEGQPAALHDIEAVNIRDGRLWVELVPDRTRCKAAERRVATLTGGCCGVGAEPPAEPSVKRTDAGCGCGVPAATAGEKTVCCA